MKKFKLGDYVEAIAKATGTKAIVEKVFDDCGCDKRKKKLNGETKDNTTPDKYRV